MVTVEGHGAVMAPGSEAVDLARRLMRLGRIREFPGAQHHPFIQWALMLCGWPPDSPDETPWCGAFLAVIALCLGWPIPAGAAAARSWLSLGADISQAMPGDVVVFARPEGGSTAAHVALVVAVDGSNVRVIGGNQSNAITETVFPATRVLGVRRYTRTDTAFRSNLPTM